MLTKRRKVDAECRDFSDVWTEKYFFTLHFGIPTFGDHALSMQIFQRCNHAHETLLHNRHRFCVFAISYVFASCSLLTKVLYDR